MYYAYISEEKPEETTTGIEMLVRLNDSLGALIVFKSLRVSNGQPLEHRLEWTLVRGCLQKTSLATNAINNPPTPPLPVNLLPLYVITSKFATDTVIRYDNCRLDYDT